MIINEIFQSIDGEVNHWGQGAVTTFVRFQGCNLSCSYCDTLYAQKTTVIGKESIITSRSNIIQIINEYDNQKITITGGEPLLQLEDVQWLCNYYWGYPKSIETNGSIYIPEYMKMREDISLVIDFKLEQPERMEFKNFMGLNKRHWVKFVISSEDDYFEVKDLIGDRPYMKKANLALSPNHDKMPADCLVDLVKRDKSGVLFNVNIQLHKYIWEKNTRKV